MPIGGGGFGLLTGNSGVLADDVGRRFPLKAATEGGAGAAFEGGGRGGAALEGGRGGAPGGLGAAPLGAGGLGAAGEEDFAEFVSGSES